MIQTHCFLTEINTISYSQPSQRYNLSQFHFPPLLNVVFVFLQRDEEPLSPTASSSFSLPLSLSFEISLSSLSTLGL